MMHERQQESIAGAHDRHFTFVVQINTVYHDAAGAINRPQQKPPGYQQAGSIEIGRQSQARQVEVQVSADQKAHQCIVDRIHGREA